MKPPISNTRQVKGFALVVTVSLLVLLSVIALGFLSLSAVTLRNGTQDQAQMEARANARLALQIAIGELQKELGPDQRISANSAIVATTTVPNPHWTGAWDSWIAGPLSGAPTNAAYPSPESHHQTIGNQTDGSMHPDYANKDKHFRRWLLSLYPDEASELDSPLSLTLDGKPMPAGDETAIRLVGKGSLGETAPSTDFVSARLIDVKHTSTSNALRSRYAWWVGDESQKARVMHDSYVSTPPANSAEKIFRGQSPGSTGTKSIKDLEEITADQETRLKGLPTLNTLDLVVNNTSKQPAKRNFHTVTPFSQSVLADVREGGLKRDLSVILEQPIDRANSGDEYMLYALDDPRFSDRSNSRVPIQDLAAYYQLYDDVQNFSNSRREGVRYTSTGLANSLQVRVPDHDGNTKNRQRILREYTTLYKQPVITKVQFLAAIGAQEVTPLERQTILTNASKSPPTPTGLKPMRDSDTHKLRLGMIPMVTLWNPNNLPLVMDAAQILRFSTPPFGIRWRKYRADGTVYDNVWSNLSYAAEASGGGSTTGQASGFCQLRLRIARNTAPLQRIVFEPGEVKVFSLPSTAGGTLKNWGTTVDLVSEGTNMDVINGWDPFGFFLMANSSPQGNNGNQAPEAYDFQFGAGASECLVFNPADRISLSIDTENPAAAAMAQPWRDGRWVAGASEIRGAGFNLYMLDEGYQTRWQDAIDFLRNYAMIGRHGGADRATAGRRVSQFYKDLMTPGFPGGVAPIQFETETNAMSGSQIIAASNAGEVISILEFSLSVGSEAGAGSTGGFGGGRRITSRPFLHSSASAPPVIDQNDRASLYNYGWDWQLGKVNSIEDSIVTAKPGTGNGYYGGGYTIESGTTHVVQREIPALPAISIASLSHAHLGGFSLGYANVAGDNPDTDTLWFKSGRIVNPLGTDYQKTTATGQAGLAPHIAQAIGNSYAHPNLPADKAFTTWTRLFDEDEGAKIVPFADHSYLANKALWDEYFFSSMSPQPAKVELFGGTSQTAKEVADEFFFGSSASPLPNRRLIPYKTNLDQTKLDTLFATANIFSNGLGDKIADHLLVDGAFNVNSTSVEAWKIFFSSLRGKPVAYLPSGKAPLESVVDNETPLNSSMLPNAKPISTSDITSPNTPPEQWKAGRNLTDDEIKELAEAMVKQVKLRGPFLSLSEFINRRLDGANTDGMALKGALQAALDDPSVSINANFRTPERILDGEVGGIGFAFPDAANGPIAYGSQPYVDQADILRGLAEQLTPRGDTFVIRTYGDSLDAQGKVVARAWCEAVVQRVPDYVDQQDENHIRTASLQSEANRNFGRTFNVVSFRWLNSDEI